MDEITITVHPFRMGTDKEAALKPLEEASEVRAAWQEYNRWLSFDVDDKYREDERINLANEIADCIQASVNLAARYGIDLSAAMLRCEERNRERGRYDYHTCECQKLRKENAKLRNLVEALLQCAGETKRDKGCDACPMWTAIYEDDCLRYSSCMLRPTLRELGIEVK